jgi:hypothetical protein
MACRRAASLWQSCWPVAGLLVCRRAAGLSQCCWPVAGLMACRSAAGLSQSYGLSKCCSCVAELLACRSAAGQCWLALSQCQCWMPSHSLGCALTVLTLCCELLYSCVLLDDLCAASMVSTKHQQTRHSQWLSLCLLWRQGNTKIQEWVYQSPIVCTQCL